MTLQETKKLTTHIQRLLKVRHVLFPIANTEKGNFLMKFTKGNEDYDLVLDSVPLNMNDYDNRELKSMLEKYLFEKEETSIVSQSISVPEVSVESVEVPAPEKKKRGRPAKK